MVGPGWTARALAALIFGAGWLLVVVVHRVEKLLVLPAPPSAFDSLAFLLPEIALCAWLTALWLVAASWKGRGALWWPAFVLFQLVAHTFSAVEQGYFEHTGMRLHSNMAAYAWQNGGEVGDIVRHSADIRFYIDLATSLLLLLVAALVTRRAYSRALESGKLKQTAIPSPRWLMVLIAVAVVASVVPASAHWQRIGMERNAVVEFWRPVPSLEGQLNRVSDAELPPALSPPVLDGEASRRPNIILLILESTGANVTPPTADPGLWANTPFLVDLANRSLVFERTYASVTHTSKALVGILCGAFPSPEMAIIEASRRQLPFPCLPRLLSDLGYRSAFLQSAEGAFENRPLLLQAMGFDTGAFRETMARDGFSPLGYLAMEDRVMVEPAEQWLDGGEDPFFLTMLTSVTHHPYQVPWLPVNPPPASFPVYYMAALHQQDAFLAELWQMLERKELLQDSVIIVVGDHGEAFGEHVRQQHNFVPYEEVTRVPLMIHAPELLGPARRDTALRHHFDLLPTLLDILQVPWSGVVAGRSLLSQGHQEVLTACWGSNTCLAWNSEDRAVAFHYGFRPTEVFAASGNDRQLDLASQLDETELDRLERKVLAHRRAMDQYWQ